MSHIVTIRTQIRDAEALRLACRRLQLAEPTAGTAKLFSTEAAGHLVALPGWRYPVVCSLENGSLAYDNFEGRWGDPLKLQHLIQAYAAEKTKLEARKAGHSVIEQTLPSGAIKLTVQVAGGAL